MSKHILAETYTAFAHHSNERRRIAYDYIDKFKERTSPKYVEKALLEQIQSGSIFRESYLEINFDGSLRHHYGPDVAKG